MRQKGRTGKKNAAARAPERRSGLQGSLWTALAFILVGAAIYSNTFHASFHFDDQPAIVANTAIHNLADLKAIFHYWPNRFVAFLTLALDYHFHQLRLPGYHLVNLAIHLGAALFAWWLALLTFSTPALKNSPAAGHGRLLALFGGLLFLVHPLQTEAVTYIYQRSASLAAFFYLGSLCLYARARLGRLKGQGPGRWAWAYGGALAAALLAMFTKENSFTLPLAVLMYELFFFKRTAGRWKYPLPFLLLLPVVPLVYLAGRNPNTEVFQRITMQFGDLTPGSYLLTQLRVIVTYLRMVFVPVNQNLDYDYPIAHTLWNLPTLASLFLILLVLAWGVFLFRRRRLLSFSIFFFFLTLSVESSVLPLRDLILEHRLYLPLFGYALFLPAGLLYLAERWKRAGNGESPSPPPSPQRGEGIRKELAFSSRWEENKSNIPLPGGERIKVRGIDRKQFYSLAVAKSDTIITILLFALVAGYGVMTYNRNRVWQNELTLWSDVIKKAPGKARAYNNRGVAYRNNGEYQNALADFNRAVALDSNFEQGYADRGNIYNALGQYDRAIADYTKAVGIDPNVAGFYYNRGLSYLHAKEPARAVDDFTRTLRLDPSFLKAYRDRGLAYTALGQKEEAARDFQAISRALSQAEGNY